MKRNTFLSVCAVRCFHLTALSVLFIIFSNNKSIAQISEKGTPISFAAKNFPPEANPPLVEKSKVPIIEMPYFDIEKMLEEDAHAEKYKNVPYRFAREFLVDYDIKSSGVCDTSQSPIPHIHR